MDPTLENLHSLLADFAVVDTDADAIDLTTTLASLGIDSLDLIELILEVEEQFEIEIPEVEVALITTIDGLYQAILRAQGGE